MDNLHPVGFGGSIERADGVVLLWVRRLAANASNIP